MELSLKLNASFQLEEKVNLTLTSVQNHEASLQSIQTVISEQREQPRDDEHLKVLRRSRQ